MSSRVSDDTVPNQKSKSGGTAKSAYATEVTTAMPAA